jgi:6,7-dimethyl-8-ribityllumazine synthase
MGKNLQGAPVDFEFPSQQIQGDLNGQGHTFGVVCSRFNSLITKSLLMGTIQALIQHQVPPKNIFTYWVPGAFEIPMAMDHFFPKVDGMIALGCVIKGDTPHFDYVCQGVTLGVQTVSLNHKKPGIFGVITTLTQQQAEDRSRPNCVSNKGFEAGLNAIEMVRLTKAAAI